MMTIANIRSMQVFRALMHIARERLDVAPVPIRSLIALVEDGQVVARSRGSTGEMPCETWDVQEFAS